VSGGLPSLKATLRLFRPSTGTGGLPLFLPACGDGLAVCLFDERATGRLAAFAEGPVALELTASEADCFCSAREVDC